MPCKPTEYRITVRDVDNGARDKRRKYGSDVADVYPTGTLMVVSYSDPEREDAKYNPAYWVNLANVQGSVSPTLAKRLMEASEIVTLDVLTPRQVSSLLVERFSWHARSILHALIRHGVPRGLIESALLAEEARDDDTDD